MLPIIKKKLETASFFAHILSQPKIDKEIDLYMKLNDRIVRDWCLT